MKKLLAVFATVLFCQAAHAIPVVPGAVDLASDDGKTYYALVAKNGVWYIDGYNKNGSANGYSVPLTKLNNGQAITTSQQSLAGLAFDGSSFYVLRNDSLSSRGTDTWSVTGFGVDGQFNSFATQLKNMNGNVNIAPSKQTYVGLDWADGDVASGVFYGLRNDTASINPQNGWTVVGFNTSTGQFMGHNVAISGHNSGFDYTGLAVYAASPNHYEPTTNVQTAGVPSPTSGLVLSTLLLGLAGRRMFKAA